jgi:hypothetical protein
MTPEDAKKTPPSPPPAQHKGERGTGEGAGTALEALIRKRKQAELPDPADRVPPTPPAA